MSKSKSPTDLPPNKLAKGVRPHTTHYACDERMALYGGKTVGCCCTGHVCEPKDQPDTAEAKIEKVLDDAFDMGAGKFPEDYKNLKKGMVAKLKGLLVDAQIKEIEDAKNAWAENRFSVWRETRLAALLTAIQAKRQEIEEGK